MAQYTIICALILIVADIIIWLRIIRTPPGRRSGQIVGAVALLIGAVVSLAFGLASVG